MLCTFFSIGWSEICCTFAILNIYHTVQRCRCHCESLQVIYHIAERLDDLHAAGYCHRDLKPGNVMWLPRKNRWTLIDFGCAAKLGEEASLAYSLAYAAPEVAHAVRNQHDSIVATDKLDAWSLGVMAVELLTNKPPFNLLEGKDKVKSFIFKPCESTLLCVWFMFCHRHCS
jgi:serine/threonine protein kinase